MEIKFEKPFTKRYLKLSKRLRVQCDERIILFQEDRMHPLLDDHPLHGEYAGCRSINVTGDYRAIYVEVRDIVWFTRIGTHHELFGT